MFRITYSPKNFDNYSEILGLKILDMTNEDLKNNVVESEVKLPTDSNKYKADLIGKGLFFTLITSLGLISGFGISLGSTKKQNSKSLKKTKKSHYLQESGAELARRALVKATIITVSGFSIFCFTVWKLSGAQNFQEFRHKVGTFLPKISNKNKEKEGRREFENLTELWYHLIDEDQKKKKNKIEK